MQEQLSELALQVMHVIQACNEEKDILQAEFDSVRNGILIMESRLQLEKVRIDCEVSGVGSMMQLLQAVLQDIQSGIHILPNQDNQILSEGTDLFAGICQGLEAQSKRITNNSLQLLVVKSSNLALQKHCLFRQ